MSEKLRMQLDSHVDKIVFANLTSGDFGFSMIWYGENRYQISTRPHDAKCSDCNDKRKIHMQLTGDQYATVKEREDYAKTIFDYLTQRINREPVDKFSLVRD